MVLQKYKQLPAEYFFEFMLRDELAEVGYEESGAGPIVGHGSSRSRRVGDRRCKRWGWEKVW